MSTRRRDVLTVLREAATPLSIAQIAGELAVHPNTARFHLEALVEAGQVESVEVDRSGPGRPPLMFRAVAGMDPAGPRDYRMLAGILADALARQPDAARRGVAAGRSWAERATAPARTRSRRQAVDRLTGMLTELGFAPETRRGAGAIGEIGLRNCPFLELADTRRDVVCPVHLGLMQGALSAWEAPITVEALTPFAEPDLCVVHLQKAGESS
ncbi:transcriptional regulator [Mycobacterium sp. IS-1496]|uniref:helix-turn-helix transcriptional regulator n=1 Tax=Mycobacterium sp. IS-1496 TaxID=1772284 RepID=UPI0007416746|nr:helix-turn-helix domain-containing protein [Mycobacterium sp. IS-1496]KUI34284.1 transcriptional regulator [Mycobacterium sp. IS-1496]